MDPWPLGVLRVGTLPALVVLHRWSDYRLTCLNGEVQVVFVEWVHDAADYFWERLLGRPAQY